jgi:hypothetical protein
LEQFSATTTNAGRKGIAYDWKSIVVADETATLDLDRELAALTPQYAE